MFATIVCLWVDGAGEQGFFVTMKPTMKAESETPSSATHWLSEQDYEPVRSLIEEARRRRNTVNALTIWLNAFTLFKQIERRIGLPGDDDRDSYLAIVCDLRASGHRLSVAVNAQGIDLEKEVEIRPAAFRACLDELAFDDRAEFFGQDAAMMKKIELSFEAKGSSKSNLAVIST
jgi:hypothetical protein